MLQAPFLWKIRNVPAPIFICMDEPGPSHCLGWCIAGIIMQFPHVLGFRYAENTVWEADSFRFTAAGMFYDGFYPTVFFPPHLREYDYKYLYRHFVQMIDAAPVFVHCIPSFIQAVEKFRRFLSAQK